MEDKASPPLTHELLRPYRKRGRGALSTSRVLGIALVTPPSPGEIMLVEAQQGATLSSTCWVNGGAYNF